MRKIQTQDVFKLARIIRLSGAKDELTEALKASTSSELRSSAGLDLMMSLISACGNEEVENALYDLIGNIAEAKAGEIKTMDLDDLGTLLKDISEQNNLSRFFDLAVKSA